MMTSLLTAALFAVTLPGVESFASSSSPNQQHPRCATGHPQVGCAPTRGWMTPPLRSSISGDDVFYRPEKRQDAVAWDELLEETLETAAFVATKRAMTASASILHLISDKIPKDLLPKALPIPNIFLHKKTFTPTQGGVPYDAAIMAAYFAWCQHFEKTPSESPNDDSYLNFKANYERITIANVVAKKQYRESRMMSSDVEGEATVSTPPTPILLNQYADVSPEEYEILSQPPTWEDILGNAVHKAVSAVKELVPPEPKRKWSAAPRSFLSFLQQRQKAAHKNFRGTASTSSKSTRTSTSRLLFGNGGIGDTLSSNNRLDFLFSSLTATVPPAATFSVPQQGVATISWWMQNSDGSITGRVSNNNDSTTCWIRTSPVLQKAEPNTMVKTQSGSKYWLK